MLNVKKWIRYKFDKTINKFLDHHKDVPITEEDNQKALAEAREAKRALRKHYPSKAKLRELGDLYSQAESFKRRDEWKRILSNIDDIANAEQTYNDLISHERAKSKKSAEERGADAIRNR